MKMPKIKFPPILMKLGDLVEITFIRMNLNFHVKILIRTLLFLIYLRTGIGTSDWAGDWLVMNGLGTDTCVLGP